MAVQQRVQFGQRQGPSAAEQGQTDRSKAAATEVGRIIRDGWKLFGAIGSRLSTPTTQGGPQALALALQVRHEGAPPRHEVSELPVELTEHVGEPTALGLDGGAAGPVHRSLPPQRIDPVESPRRWLMGFGSFGPIVGPEVVIVVVVVLSHRRGLVLALLMQGPELGGGPNPMPVSAPPMTTNPVPTDDHSPRAIATKNPSPLPTETRRTSGESQPNRR